MVFGRFRKITKSSEVLEIMSKAGVAKLADAGDLKSRFMFFGYDWLTINVVVQRSGGRSRRQRSG